MYLHGKYWWQSEPGHCNTYGNWIETNYPNKESCVNKCNEAVSAMVDYFSELTVQVGYANGTYHCWCKCAEGNIVDPTSKQFEGEIKYTLIAERFLQKHEIELSTGAIFIDHGKDDAAPIANLVEEFCDENKLDEPRDGWGNNLIHPSGE